MSNPKLIEAETLLRRMRAAVSQFEFAAEKIAQLVEGAEGASKSLAEIDRFVAGYAEGQETVSIREMIQAFGAKYSQALANRIARVLLAEKWEKYQTRGEGFRQWRYRRPAICPGCGVAMAHTVAIGHGVYMSKPMCQEPAVGTQDAPAPVAIDPDAVRAAAADRDIVLADELCRQFGVGPDDDAGKAVVRQALGVGYGKEWSVGRDSSGRGIFARKQPRPAAPGTVAPPLT